MSFFLSFKNNYTATLQYSNSKATNTKEETVYKTYIYVFVEIHDRYVFSSRIFLSKKYILKDQLEMNSTKMRVRITKPGPYVHQCMSVLL